MHPSRFLLLVGATLALAAPPARAQTINFAWHDCAMLPNAAANLSYACDGSRNGLPWRAVMSFASPGDLTAFVGMQAIVDLHVGSLSTGPLPNEPLPDWWRLGLGECREGNLVFPASMLGIGTGATGACRNPWTGATTGGGFNVQAMNPSQTRLRFAFARDAGAALVNAQEYIGGVFSLDSWGDIAGEQGQCLGCCSPIVLVLNSIEVYQISGTYPADYYLLTSGAQQFITWQSPYAPNPPACLQTPTVSRTWGSIKATYR
jgi:hypothetical protein